MEKGDAESPFSFWHTFLLCIGRTRPCHRENVPLSSVTVKLTVTGGEFYHRWRWILPPLRTVLRLLQAAIEPFKI